MKDFDFVYRATMLKLASALSILALVALAGCSKKLDNTKLEASINDGLKAKGTTLKSVSCPAGRDIKAGDSFDCDGTTPDGEKVVIKVDQKDDEGNIAWKTVSLVGTQKEIGNHLVSALGKGATAKCGDKVIVVKKDTTFECDGTVDGKPAKISFKSKDDQGNFHINAKIEGAEAPVEGDAQDKE